MYTLTLKQQELLNSLRWEYDEDLPDVPWEYTVIKWNKGKIKELEEFWNTIFYSKETENYIVLDDEPMECFTCIKTTDYYYGVSEKDDGFSIGRTFSNIHKLRKIYNFMKSQDFEYQKGMSLSDIYSQLLAKGIEKY